MLLASSCKTECCVLIERSQSEIPIFLRPARKYTRKYNLAECVTNIIGKSVGVFCAAFVTGITL